MKNKEQLEIGDKIKTYRDGWKTPTILEVESVTKTKATLTNGVSFKRSLKNGLTFYNSHKECIYKYELIN